MICLKQVYAQTSDLVIHQGNLEYKCLIRVWLIDRRVLPCSSLVNALQEYLLDLSVDTTLVQQRLVNVGGIVFQD